MALIKRTQTPPPGKKYQFYKPFLRIDFEYRCAYCRNREVVEGGSKKFHIDHYRPQKKFPNLINCYSNLFYSCAECNNSKRDYWPTFIQKLKSQYILNPCDHDFEMHFNTKHPKWRGNTSVAMWNIEKLRLNSWKRIKFREDETVLCEMINTLTQQEIELKNLFASDKLSDSLIQSIEEDLTKIQKQIAVLKRKTFEPLE